MNDSELDDLLNTPLTAVADRGFSARVVAHARMERMKGLAVGFLCIAAALFYIPLPQIAVAIAHALSGTAVLPAISLAVAALVLTFAAERALARG